MLKPRCWVFVSVGFTSANSTSLGSYMWTVYLLKKNLHTSGPATVKIHVVQDQLLFFLTCWAYWLDRQSLDFFKKLETISHDMLVEDGSFSKAASWMPMVPPRFLEWFVVGERDPLMARLFLPFLHLDQLLCYLSVYWESVSFCLIENFPYQRKKLETPWINWWWMCAWLSICVLTVPIKGLISPESPGTLLLSFLKDLLTTSKRTFFNGF